MTAPQQPESESAETAHTFSVLCACGERWTTEHAGMVRRAQEAARLRVAYWAHRESMGGWHDAPQAQNCQDECFDDIAARLISPGGADMSDLRAGAGRADLVAQIEQAVLAIEWVGDENAKLLGRDRVLAAIRPARKEYPRERRT